MMATMPGSATRPTSGWASGGWTAGAAGAAGFAANGCAEGAGEAPGAADGWRAPYRCCALCPRGCGADRIAGEVGACAAPERAFVARAALHHWEEPPISGQAGSGIIFLSFCTLGCSYCQNAAIARGGGGAPATPEQIAGFCLDLQAQGALNINLVTPTHYAPTLRRAVALARAEGLCLPVLWNTSGYETVRAVRENRGTVDAYLADFKYADGRLALALSGAGDYPKRALAALHAMVEEAGPVRFDEYDGQERLVGGVVVRHLLLPGHLDDSKRVVALVHDELGSAVRLSLMNQYTPVLATRADQGDAQARAVLAQHPELARTVTETEYEELLDFADSLGIDDYYYQQGGTALESFIPEF